jgi:magnesium transporter
MLSFPFFKSKHKIYKMKNIPNEAVIKEIEYNGLKWIDIIKPTIKEIKMLEKAFNFHELLLEDCLTEHQRSKVDDFDDYCFMVLHLPRYKKELMRLDTEEIDIFFGNGYLITLHEGELKPLNSFSNSCSSSEDQRKEYMSEGSALLLYEIIKRLFDYCFPMLDKMGFMIDDINKKIFKDTSRSMLENISRVKMQTINYRMVIKPMRPVIISLEKIIRKYLQKDMEMYFDDITDKTEKIWNMLENYKEAIESIDSTFSSLTNQRINNLMKTFTILQVITLPMLLVGGLFSMNVGGIPLGELKTGFWYVFGMILVPTTLIGLIMILKRKKWF